MTTLGTRRGAEPAITVEGLCKTFRVRRQDAGRWRKVEHQALDDVSFDVDQGEILGIIGRNGAGKSTMLRILSRITVPSAGRAVVRGRLAALLEVGTGMHPELTGRENVFLNGALLGMSRRDVATRLDSIVEFAGVGDFLDTPIKRYSTGMQLRLAFSVGAHLEADVLVVDEVLAVGDAEFQARCLGAMRDSMESGRTVLFVSHNLASVENLCQRVLWLDAGQVRTIGPPADVCRTYLASTGGTSGDSWRGQAGSGPVSIVSIDVGGASGPAVAQGDDVELVIGLEASEPVPGLQVLVTIRSATGTPILGTCSGDHGLVWNVEPGRHRVTVRLEGPRLLPQTHTVSVSVFRSWGAERFDDVAEAVRFEVHPADVFGSGVVAKADRGVTWTPSRFALDATEGGGATT